jgi:hypothetical protein
LAFEHKSYRKFLATVMATTMFSTAIVPAVSAASFSDVSARYQDAVEYLVKEDISKGMADGTFGVQSQIKRVDAAVWVARALGLENYGAPDSGFEDVPPRAVKAVNVLKDLGIINGKTATTFGSNDPLTRSELAKIITIAYDLPIEGREHPFRDVSSTFTHYVQAVYQAGITNGVDGNTFGANDYTKRGDFAIFLKKAEQFEVTVPEILVSYVTGVINEDNTVTLSGNAEGIKNVIVSIPNGETDVLVETQVINGMFSVTTELPEIGIHEITILDTEGNTLYKGITEQVISASLGNFTINSLQ